MQKKFWTIIFFSYLLVLTYLSISNPIIETNPQTYEDKIAHVIAYFVGADLCALTIKFNKKNFFIYLTSIIFFLLPLILEYLQNLNPYRVFSLKDMFASYIGVGIGLTYFIFKELAFKHK